MDKKCIIAVLIPTIMLIFVIILGSIGFMYLKKNMIMKIIINTDKRDNSFTGAAQPEARPETQPEVPPTQPEVPPTQPEVPPTQPEVPPTQPEVPPTQPVVPPEAQPEAQAEIHENFTTVTGVDPKPEPGKPRQECKNRSLNQIHQINHTPVKGNQTMCATKDRPKDDNFKKHDFPLLYEQTTHVLGSNYMAYNENPLPSRMDYPLFDKLEKENEPVGVNYVQF